jgi:hypothetical protein
MEFVQTSHRFAEQIIQQNPELRVLFNEIVESIKSISEEDLLTRFEGIKTKRPKAKSLSYAFNELLKEKLHVENGWMKEAPIFQSAEFANVWRLDFLKTCTIAGESDDADSRAITKSGIAVEVAFNHGEAIAWNLIKPVLASELNHVEKAIQTEIGVIICATADLKAAGGFDNAVGEYEKFLRYLIPLQDLLTVPLLIIGLKAPRTFRVSGKKINGRTVGAIELIHEDSE